jgi:nucleoside-diphosphate-sugar epimerase
VEQSNHNTGPASWVYWRVEGSLLELTTVRPAAFFTWNAQKFTERWLRRGLVLLMAVLRPFLYATNRAFATRVVHTVLRGISRDRLDLLGEEYFKYELEPNLKAAGVRQLKELVDSGAKVVLVSQGLAQVMQPLARHLGVHWVIANRMEFHDGMATGRLLDPVIRPRGVFARIGEGGADGRREAARLALDLGLRSAGALHAAVVPAARQMARQERPIVHFDWHRPFETLSVRQALRGKNVLLIGVTGFIGKVWLVNTLMDLPELGRIYLLIRRQKSTPAERRFERLVEESPVFDPLYARYRGNLPGFLRERVEVVEGDVCQEGLGLAPRVAEALGSQLDLVINSSGLTDFNPDLRDALATNVDAAVHILDFVRRSDHAGLLHLSTCYVAGARDGRVGERLRPNYTPAGLKDFDAEREWRALHAFVKNAEQKAESAEVTEELRQQAREKEHAAKDLQGAALENQVRKNRVRWLRNYLTEAGTKRAQELGWPNTYTLTKSLAESLIHTYGTGLPVAVVRPAIVETSIERPFLGWNEGIAVLSAGNLFPSAALERAQAAGYYSGGCGVRRHDAGGGGDCRAPQPSGVSAGDLGFESLRYGAIDRTDFARAPQTLPGAGGAGVVAAAAFRCHCGFQAALPAPVGAGANCHHQVDSADHVSLAAAQAPSGASRAQPGESGETDSTV